MQKEVIGATLANEYDIDVEFRETTTICVERPVGVGAAVEMIHEDTFADHSVPRHCRAAHRSGRARLGVQFRLESRCGTIPTHVFKTVEAFQDAMERTVRETLRQGIYGWEVTDCTVTMTIASYKPRQSHATVASARACRAPPQTSVC